MIKNILNRLPRSKSSKRDGGENGNVSYAHTVNTNSASANDNGNSKEYLTKEYLMAHQSALPLRPLAVTARISNGTVKTAPVPIGVGVFNTISEPLPLFRDVPSSERPNLFITKLNLCSTIFDFSDATKHIKEKEIKRQTLIELVDFIGTANIQYSELIIEEVTKMVSANLFRALSPSVHDNLCIETFDAEEEEPCMEPAWSHLQHVYDFFLRFVMSPEMDAKIAKRYIDHSFVLKLLDLFDSEDSREREYLKMILHRIYGKFMVHRPFIRKAINNIFYRFIFETERHNGIAELLEIMGSIINGFALPLKEEHKLFLVRALMPLHKAKCVSVYHRQLSHCVVQFVEKDLKLADIIIRGLLKYWPLTNSHKEVLFLSELEEVLEATQPAEFQRCMVPLFKQVAERSLFLWNNDHIVNLVAQNRAVILPIIYPALAKNTQSHWNQAVHGLTLNARKMFLEMDQDLFQECQRRYEEEEAEMDNVNGKRRLVWEKLEAMAASGVIAK
ncbi:hypothetical protein KP509_01G065800 [Ceratopteris richardii]|uniref:Serine/threonine protein phosphatase 2A regulatory subunit n=1 Tax=Ceratopteris richardii TaxID=49495 RepID=A0A8T2VDR3_CERRI|nr:hypothetical protein KP509_01G065800 [Ceratopteris richardii]